MANLDNSISQDEVRNQLRSIMNCDELKNSPILSRFLEFVVNETLDGHDDAIKEYTIGVKALGRPADFNPQLDAAVRIHAGRLRKIISQYYQQQGKSDSVFITIPKGSYIPIFHRGVQHVSDFSEKTSTDFFNSREINQPSSREQFKPVLAVLPFHNLSPENSKDYFVVGIGEQLATDLARFQNVSVISYYSTSRYDSTVRDLQELKNFIRMDFVLTGSVRFVNDTVRVSVHLLSSANGEILWTETYVRHLTPDNIFDIQNEISNQVLNIIADDNGIIFKINKSHFAGTTHYTNHSGQQAIYKYFDYVSDYDPLKFEIAINAIEGAVKAEADHPLLCAILAGLYLDIYITDFKMNPALLEKAILLSQKAINLEQHSQHAYKSLAWALLVSGKIEDTLEIIEKCIQLNPKSSIMQSNMGLALICVGQFEKGFNTLLQSNRLNTFIHPSTKLGFALYHFHQKNYPESLKWIERLNYKEQPLFSLLNISLHGKISKTAGMVNGFAMSIKENAQNMIDRIILDPKLNKEIMHGLRQAGV